MNSFQGDGMNKLLKAKIFERYGTQYDFSRAVNAHESYVSRVVQERKILPVAEQHLWAKLLGEPVSVLFGKEPVYGKR